MRNRSANLGCSCLKTSTSTWQPLIREYALLEVPINPVCKVDCKGLCPVCGENLNQADCGHKDLNEESPFSALKDLLDE
jgi:uncharacterized protein